MTVTESNLPRPADSALNSLSFSIIVPALNEGIALKETLATLKTITKEEDEIIVVDGGSQDATVSIAAAFADQVISSPPGRARQMDAGAKKATKDILIFLHADTQLPLEWRRRLTLVWTRDPRPGLAAFHVAFNSTRKSLRFIARLANWRTRKMTKVPHGDQAISVERKAYLSSGGFPDVPLMEEYYLARRLRPFGELRLIPDPVITSARRYEKNGVIVNNLRNLCILTLFYAGASPRFLAKLYK